MMSSHSEKENKVSLYNKPTAASIGQRKMTPPPQSGASGSRIPPRVASSNMSHTRNTGDGKSDANPTPQQRAQAAQQEFFDNVDAFKEQLSTLGEIADQFVGHDEAAAANAEKYEHLYHAFEELQSEKNDHYRRLFEEERQRSGALEEKIEKLEAKNSQARTFCEEVKEDLNTARHELDHAHEKQLRTESECKAALLEEKLAHEELRSELNNKLRESDLEAERQRSEFKCEQNAHENALFHMKEKYQAKKEKIEDKFQSQISDLNAELDALREELSRKVSENEDQSEQYQSELDAANQEKEILRQSAAEKFDDMSEQLHEKEDAIESLQQKLRDATTQNEELRDTYLIEVEKVNEQKESNESDLFKARNECGELQESLNEANHELHTMHQRLEEMQIQMSEQQEMSNSNSSRSASASASASSSAAATNASSSSKFSRSNGNGNGAKPNLSLAEARQQHRRVGFHDNQSMEQFESLATNFKANRRQ